MKAEYSNQDRRNKETKYMIITYFIEFVIAFIIGIGIGNVITLAYSSIYGYYLPTTKYFIETQSSLLEAAIKSNLAYGLMGVIGKVSGIVFKGYDPEKPGKISLFQRTTISLFINLLGFFLVGSYLGWIRGGLNAVVLFILVYFIIWSASYSIKKIEIMKINKKLSERDKNN